MSDFIDRELSLSELELITVDLPQKETFTSAIGQRKSRRALLLRWVDREGHWGIGECSARSDPYFSHEYLDGVRAVLADHLFPVLDAEMTYGELVGQLDRIRGWGFARATVLAAIHDLWRRGGEADPLDHWREDERLYHVPVGVSLGLFDNAAVAIEKIAARLEAGFRRVKLKIRPGLDPAYLKTIRETFPDTYLGVDANGSFDETGLGELAAMAQHGLAMIEQPFPPDRLDLCSGLRQRADVRICLDESVREPGHLISAIRLGAIDELNIKPGRVGGIPNAKILAEICKEHGIPAWVGGMFETGIGRAANLRFAACFPEARAHDLSPSSRYFETDLVQYPIEMDGNGRVIRPDLPVTLEEEAMARFEVDRVTKRK